MKEEEEEVIKPDDSRVRRRLLRVDETSLGIRSERVFITKIYRFGYGRLESMSLFVTVDGVKEVTFGDIITMLVRKQLSECIGVGLRGCPLGRTSRVSQSAKLPSVPT